MLFSIEYVEGGVTTYTVYSAVGLQEVNRLVQNKLSANITLAADITLPTPSDGGSNWTSIGTYSSSKEKAYTGTFDGAGHIIRGLVINNRSNYQGLVGFLYDGGAVRNVTLEGCTMTANNYAGGIVGQNDGGTIENCTVKATSSYPVSIEGIATIGGIVGMNYSAITGCRMIAEGGDCKVKGTSAPVGGITGSNFGSGSLDACFAKGVNVTANGDKGGIVGKNQKNLTGSYAYQCTWGAASPPSALEGDANVVGINNNGTVSECYYVTSGGADLFGYNNTTTADWQAALAAMNSAIESTGWTWGGTADNPTLTHPSNP